MEKDISYAEHLNNCLRKAYDIHGHGHCVGEGKDETNRSSKLWTQTSGDQVVRSACKPTKGELHVLTGASSDRRFSEEK